MATKKYELTAEQATALATDPVDMIANWWMANSTEAEQADAEARGATPSGAFAFVEEVARKAQHGDHGACLPDALTYQLAAIFLRNGADGDEFLTADEIREREEAEARREADKARRREEAAKREEERKASLTPEQLEEERRREEERARIAAEAEAKRKAAQAERDAIRARRERAKAIRDEMERAQLTFNF